MEKELYIVMDSNNAYPYAEFFEEFSDAKQNAIELAQENPDYEYAIYKAEKIGTALVPLKAQYFEED